MADEFKDPMGFEAPSVVGRRLPLAAKAFVDPFDSMGGPIDRETGAPASVRLAVGAAEHPEDRLSTLRKTYPDAAPTKRGDNFVFTNPDTGKPTLYNPPGPDWGDFPSLLPEAGEALGATAGGVAAAAALPESFGTSLLAVPAAMGTGAAIGREGAERAGQFLLGTDDTRSGLQRLKDRAWTFGTNMFGGVAGETGARLLGSAIRNPESRTFVPMFERNDVPYTSETGLGGGAGATQRLMQSTLFGGPHIDAAKDATNEGMSQAALRFTGKVDPLGQGFDATSAGAATKRGLEGFYDRFRDRGSQLFDQMDQFITPQDPVLMKNTHGVLTDFRDKMVGARAIGQAEEPAGMGKRWQALLDDLNTEAGVQGYQPKTVQDLLDNVGLPFGAMKAWRSLIGRKLTDPMAVDDLPRAELKRLYGALSSDLEDAAAAKGPEAAQAYSRANTYWKAGMDRIEKYLQDISDKGLNDQAYRAMMQSPERLRAVRKSIDPNEWDIVSGYTIRNMGMKGRQAVEQGVDGTLSNSPTMGQWDPKTFLQNWKALGYEGQHALVGGTRYAALRPELNDLVRMSEHIVRANRAESWISPARYAYFGLLSTGGIAAGLMSGALPAAKVMIGGLAAPGVAARLLTNQKFVRWMNGIPTHADSESTWARHLGTLPAMLTHENEDVQDAGRQYLRSLREAVMPGAQ